MKRYLPSYWKESLFHPAIFYALLGICLCPFALLLYYFHVQHEKFISLSNQIEMIERKAIVSEKRQAEEQKVLSAMKQADPYYLDKHVESLLFLEMETQKAKSIASDAATTSPQYQRLQFLLSDKNKLRFVEGSIQKNDRFQEYEEKQTSPVEINEDDLKKVLSSIEGVRVHPFYPQEKRPHLLIKSFDLSKKSIAETKEKVYVVSMSLLKREYKQD